jgi:hypothetical protein
VSGAASSVGGSAGSVSIGGVAGSLSADGTPLVREMSSRHSGQQEVPIVPLPDSISLPLTPDAAADLLMAAARAPLVSTYISYRDAYAVTAAAVASYVAPLAQRRRSTVEQPPQTVARCDTAGASAEDPTAAPSRGLTESSASLPLQASATSSGAPVNERALAGPQGSVQCDGDVIANDSEHVGASSEDRTSDTTTAGMAALLSESEGLQRPPLLAVPLADDAAESEYEPIEAFALPP